MFGLEMEFFRSAVRTTSRELSAQKSGGQSHSVFQHAQTKQTPERICRKKLYTLLALLGKAETASHVRTAEDGNGLKAWQASLYGPEAIFN